MKTSQTADLRAHRRRRLIGFMPGRLYTADRQEIYCRPLDVSSSGFGIFTEEKLDAGAKDFILVIAEREIELILVYSVESPALKIGYRNGFRVRDQSIDLEKMCLELGYL